jgi:hypothetical protein
MSSSSDYHTETPVMVTPQTITQHALLQMSSTGRRFWVAVLILGVLFALGIVGFIIRATGGFDDRVPWGYYAATFGFLFTAVQTAPMVAIAMRMVKANWGKPLVRASELFALASILNLLIFIPLMFLIPSLQGRSSLWVSAPIGAPHTWDLLVVLFLVICSLGILYTSLLPDLAAIRDHAEPGSFRQRFAARLSPFWQGTQRQWRLMRSALTILGGLYFMFIIFGHALLSTDIAESLVPGWKDSIFPAFHALSGLQSALAIVIVTLFCLRTFGGYKNQIHVEQFWHLSKIMMAFCLLWFYFWFSEFITYWYGRMPTEQNLLKYLMFDTYRFPFLMAFFFSFVVPFFGILLWKPFRKSIIGPTIAAVFILIGMFFDRIRIYVASFGVRDSLGHEFDTIYPATLPGAPDIFIMIGGIAGSALIYLLATRLIPPIALWEMKEDLLLRRVKKFLRREVTVLGKPE